MVSIKQIASDIGVSAATVSNALSGKGRVSTDVASRIRSRAEELGYRPSIAARALKTGQSGILGLVIPDLTNPLYPHIAQMLSLAAERRGVALLIADSRRNPEEQAKAFQRLIARGVDGLLVVPQRGTRPDPMAVPMVIINTASDPQNSVSADHVQGGILVARHISEIGHRRVMIIGADPVSEVQQDRIVGMRQALHGHIAREVAWGDDGIAQAVQAVGRGVTAIMTTSDLLALRIHSEFARANISVPHHVSLTGFDNMSFSSIMHPSLTTVAQNVEEIAQRAIDIMVSKVQGDLPEREGSIVAMRLIVRQSTAIPPNTSARSTH